MATRPGDRERHPQRADSVDTHLIEAVALESDREPRSELRAGVPGAAQAAQSLLTHREDDGERLRQIGRKPFDDVERHGDRKRVVADARATEPPVPLRHGKRDVGGEHRVDVCEERECVRRFAQVPYQVPNAVARACPRLARETVLEPGQPLPLRTRGRGNAGKRDSVALEGAGSRPRGLSCSARSFLLYPEPPPTAASGTSSFSVPEDQRSATSASAFAQATRSSTGTYSSTAWAIVWPSLESPAGP